MPKSRSTIVTQDPNAPLVTAAVLAQSIKAIAEGMRMLRRGRLNDKALLLLIHGACKSTGTKGRLSQTEIKVVLDAIEGLERHYLRSGQQV